MNEEQRQEAIDYLNRKGKEINEENIEKAWKSNLKVYGDPIISVGF